MFGLIPEEVVNTPMISQPLLSSLDVAVRLHLDAFRGTDAELGAGGLCRGHELRAELVGRDLRKLGPEVGTGVGRGGVGLSPLDLCGQWGWVGWVWAEGLVDRSMPLVLDLTWCRWLVTSKNTLP